MASNSTKFVKLCELCFTSIDDQFFTKCKNPHCTTPYFHDGCIRMPLSLEKNTNWTCPRCIFQIETGHVAHVEIPIEGPERSYEVSYERSTIEPDVAENFPAIVQAENGDDSEAGSKPLSHFNELTDEICALRVQLAGLHERFECLDTNLTYTITNLDEVFDPVAPPEIHARQMESYQVQIISLKNQMALFKESLKNQIELVGIPEREDEDLFAIVGLAAQKIGVRFYENDLDWAARMGPRILSESVNNLCRPLVVRFVQKFKRDQFLRAAKVTRSLMTSDLNVDCAPRRVYINERLSREVRCLFHEARFRAKQNGFKFCWIHNNSVFVRKSEGHPAVRLLCQNDLNTKLGDDLTPERDTTGNEPGTA
ncbi:uncharacterized protein LOC121739018 [Aricia agestis]|uniref:uncharacterized protein LOC121739018 n=1 Tax=Aricia agestis TaxID=91739 RepID=UPI001C208458|nr:uncharacterized protein LOC121739018 [Aricia agestis]